MITLNMCCSNLTGQALRCLFDACGGKGKFYANPCQVNAYETYLLIGFEKIDPPFEEPERTQEIRRMREYWFIGGITPRKELPETEVFLIEEGTEQILGKIEVLAIPMPYNQLKPQNP